MMLETESKYDEAGVVSIPYVSRRDTVDIRKVKFSWHGGLTMQEHRCLDDGKERVTHTSLNCCSAMILMAAAASSRFVTVFAPSTASVSPSLTRWMASKPFSLEPT